MVTETVSAGLYIFVSRVKCFLSFAYVSKQLGDKADFPYYSLHWKWGHCVFSGRFCYLFIIISVISFSLYSTSLYNNKNLFASRLR